MSLYYVNQVAKQGDLSSLSLQICDALSFRQYNQMKALSGYSPRYADQIAAMRLVTKDIFILSLIDELEAVWNTPLLPRDIYQEMMNTKVKSWTIAGIE